MRRDFFGDELAVGDVCVVVGNGRKCGGGVPRGWDEEMTDGPMTRHHFHPFQLVEHIGAGKYLGAFDCDLGEPAELAEGKEPEGFWQYIDNQHVVKIG
jgi:hypothetical protein